MSIYWKHTYTSPPPPVLRVHAGADLPASQYANNVKVRDRVNRVIQVWVCLHMPAESHSCIYQIGQACHMWPVWPRGPENLSPPRCIALLSSRLLPERGSA